MFASPAFAQAGAGAPAGAAGGLLAFAPWVMILAIFYFLLIRPQQRRMKQHRDMIGAVKKNDTAITGGGVIGKVVKVEDAQVELEIASGVRIRVLKAMLSDVQPHSSKAAND